MINHIEKSSLLEEACWEKYDIFDGNKEESVMDRAEIINTDFNFITAVEEVLSSVIWKM